MNDHSIMLAQMRDQVRDDDVVLHHVLGGVEAWQMSKP